MPNWCNNTITITGSTETIKTLWDEAKEQNGLLNAMVPMPKALEDTTSPTPEDKSQPMVDGVDNWYDWHVKYWGTKWDIDLEGLEYKDIGDGTSSITGYADSAWSPPIEAFSTFCDDMDGVFAELMYFEGGMAYTGCWSSEGADDYYDYGHCDNADAVEATIPKYLDEEFNISESMREWESEQETEAETKVRELVVEKKAVNCESKETV